MTTLIQSDNVLGLIGTPYPDCAGAVVAFRAAVQVPAGAITNDLFEMLVVPVGCVVRDIILDSDDIDSGGSPAITMDVGYMSGTPGDDDISRTVGTEFFSASAVGKAGGVDRPVLKTAYRDTPNAAERSIGMKIHLQAAAGAAGEVGLTVFLAAA